MSWLHWTLPLLTLHPVVIWLLLRGLHVRPELWLVHGHQGLWWSLEMMVVLLLLLLVMVLLLLLVMVLLRLRLWLRLQRWMQRTLHVRLRMCGEEGLSRGL